MKRKRIHSILSLLFSTALIAAAFTGCNEKTTEPILKPEKSQSDSESPKHSETPEQTPENTPEASEVAQTDAPPEDDPQDIGEGETVFRFEVIDKDGNLSVWTVYTNQATVGAALLEVGLIAGDESEYGLYVKQVNNITADWDIDGTYWAFYIGGDFAMTGADTTDIEPGKIYAFVCTKG